MVKLNKKKKNKKNTKRRNIAYQEYNINIKSVNGQLLRAQQSCYLIVLIPKLSLAVNLIVMTTSNFVNLDIRD